MRRVVTGHDPSGKSIFISDGEISRTVHLQALPDINMLEEIWCTDEVPLIPVNTDDPTVGMVSFVPSIGGTRFRFFTTLPEAWTNQAIEPDGQFGRSNQIAKHHGQLAPFRFWGAGLHPRGCRYGIQRL